MDADWPEQWDEVNAAKLPPPTQPQCPEEVRVDALGEPLRCLRHAGHIGRHWCDLVNRP